jgi:hypothetical protein
VSRLCALPDATVNPVETVDMMLEVVAMAPDSTAVRESVIHCLGDLAAVSPAAANAISDPKCVALVLAAAKEGSGDVFGESSGADAGSSQSLMTTAKSVSLGRGTQV